MRAQLTAARLVATCALLAVMASACSFGEVPTAAPSLSAGVLPSGGADASALPSADTAESLAPTPAPGTCVTRPDPPPPGFTWSDCLAPAPALARNLLQDPAALQLSVLLPAAYERGGRFPVVYLLGGFASPAEVYDDALANGMSMPDVPSLRSTIVVVVNGMNTFGGSFYVNSPVSGRWEDAISTDLVGFVDRTFHTLAAAPSRGIAGDGMGGFGALSIAMHHPQTFGAVYALNATLLDDAGLQARFGDPASVDEVLAAQASLAGLTADQAAQQIDDAGNSSYATEDAFAYGVAFAPDAATRTFMRYPFRKSGSSVVRDDSIWAQWVGGLGGWPAKVATYRTNLRALRKVGLDYSSSDDAAIATGCQAVAALLRSEGVAVTESPYEGPSVDLLPDRLVFQMLPFFSGALKGS